MGQTYMLGPVGRPEVEEVWRSSGRLLEEGAGLALLTRIIPVGRLKSKHSLALIFLAKEGGRHLGEAPPSPVAHENSLPGWQPHLGWRRDAVHPGWIPWQSWHEPFMMVHELRTLQGTPVSSPCPGWPEGSVPAEPILLLGKPQAVPWDQVKHHFPAEWTDC